ncbi:MAG: hypothetical protein HYY09_03060 [Firmicutes bacterium]|nr:hypothetical protein [Bacillota bacterium]
MSGRQSHSRSHRTPSDRRLAFSRLEIRRMPGFRREGFTLEDLSPGANIIHGSNGSGKTTTARAIEALLWPAAIRDWERERGSERGRERERGQGLGQGHGYETAAVFGRMQALEYEWTVELEMGRAGWQRDGTPADAPPLPAAENRHPYRFSLPELIKAEDSDFADAIARELAGGYDLASAAQQLHFGKPAARRLNEVRALREARQQYDKARRGHEELKGEERRLSGLEREREEAGAAGRRLELVERVADWARAREQEEEARAGVDAFPEWMGLLMGDEEKRLDGLRERADKAGEEQRAAERELKSAEELIAAADLPEDGLPRELLPKLEASRDELREIERDLGAAEVNLARAVKSREEERNRLGEAADEGRLGQVDTEAVDELLEYAAGAETIAARQEAVAAFRRLLGEPRSTADPERLRQGEWFLTRWLREPGDGAGARAGASGGVGAGSSRGAAGARVPQFLAGLAGGLTALAGLILAVTVHPAYFALILAGIMVFIGARPRRVRDDGRRASCQADFQKLGLAGPEAWTEEGVEKRMEELRAEIAQAGLEEIKNQRRRELEDELRGIQDDEEQLEILRTSLVERFGIPGTTEPGKPVKKLWLAQRIAAWQDAAREAAAEATRRDALREQHARRLGGIAEILNPILQFQTFGGGGGSEDATATGAAGAGEATGAGEAIGAGALVGTAEVVGAGAVLGAAAGAAVGISVIARAADLTGIIEALDQRDKQWQEGKRREQAARDGIRRARQEAAEAGEDRRRLFEHLGFPDTGTEDEIRLRDWCRRFGEFKECRDRLIRAQGNREAQEKALRNRPDFDPGLLERSLAELEMETDELDKRAGRMIGLSEEIAGIKARIDQAKKESHLEAALAECERAQAGLERLLEKDCLAALGGLIADTIAEATRDCDLPAVFQRGREIFAAVTGGRYRLEMDRGEQPAFRAVETATGEGRALDELSSASRIQLLLSVRMAFIESQESGVRLPLLFDEVLANSDDERAGAIVEAAVAMAREGRQVFYFTAQADEVARWRRVLEAQGGDGTGEEMEAGAEAGEGVEWRIIDLAEIRRLQRAEARPLAEVAVDAKMEAKGRPSLKVPAPGDASYAEYARILGVPGIDPRIDEVEGVHLWHLLDDTEVLYELLSLGIQTWGQFQALQSCGGIKAWAGGRDTRVPRGTPGDYRLGMDLLEEAYTQASTAARALEAAIKAWRIGRGRPVDRAVLLQSGLISETFLSRVAALVEKYGGDACEILAALELGELKGFRRQTLEGLREYLEEQGYLDPRVPLDEDGLRTSFLAEVASDLTQGRISPQHLERLLAAVGTSRMVPKGSR